MGRLFQMVDIFSTVNRQPHRDNAIISIVLVNEMRDDNAFISGDHLRKDVLEGFIHVWKSINITQTYSNIQIRYQNE